MALTFISPVMLEGAFVVLEPLSDSHFDGLIALGRKPEVWTYTVQRAPDSPENARAFLAHARARQDAGLELPFAIRRKADGAFVGTTRFMDIQPANGALEIGATYLDPSVWRTAVNSETKLLTLRHAFEVLGASRVCLKTDGRNVRSQKAIERLGSVKEGVFRRHMLAGDGYLRDTVMYSIVAEEWAAVRARLEGFVAGTDWAGSHTRPS